LARVGSGAGLARALPQRGLGRSPSPAPRPEKRFFHKIKIFIFILRVMKVEVVRPSKAGAAVFTGPFLWTPLDMIADGAIMARVNSKNRTTLEAVFSHPPKSNLKWSDIEALLVSVGATVKEAEGSRVRITKGLNVLTVHRPHPAKEAKRYQVIDARIFLEALGVKP